MERIETEIEIAAPASLIWNTLVDFEHYPAWNPFISRISGTPTVGAQLEVSVQAPGQTAMTFRPIVVKADVHRELRWLGTLGIRGLFEGEHSFVLDPRGTEFVVLRHSETFRGLLVPIFAKRLRTSTKAGFEAMNRAPKQRAEEMLNTTLDP
jgi:hypothetical protein